jgi:hypothetical protein
VEGPVRCNTHTAGLSVLSFPLGKDVYRPVSLQVTHITAGPSSYQAEAFVTEAIKRNLPATLNAVSNRGYFNIMNLGSQPLSNAGVTLVYDMADGVTDAASLRIAKDDGAAGWIDIGGTGTASGNGSITATSSFTGFGDFILANANGGSNAFAVRWLQADAQPLGKQVHITWTIGNEVNIINYTIERSLDGISFTKKVALVNASAGTAVEKQYEAWDRLPEKGINFYRVKQTAKDGRISYSRIMQVTSNDPLDFIIWPNPATTVLQVQNRQPMQRLQCYNANGQLVYDALLSASQYTLPVQQWAAGIYQLKITSAGKTIQVRFVKK